MAACFLRKIIDFARRLKINSNHCLFADIKTRLSCGFKSAKLFAGSCCLEMETRTLVCVFCTGKLLLDWSGTGIAGMVGGIIGWSEVARHLDI
jgi:hypothetical protein